MANTLEVPNFIQDHKGPVDADMETKHNNKLEEIANAIDESDAKILIDILARRYPHVMLRAISKRMGEMETSLNVIYESVKVCKEDKDV